MWPLSAVGWQETWLREGRGLRGRAGRGGAAESGNSQEIPFHSGTSRPPSLGADLSGPWERENGMLFGFPSICPPAPGTLGFGARAGSQDAGAPEFGAFVSAGRVSNPPAAPGAPERAPARSPSSGRRPPASVPFSLSWCHMSRGGVGTRGVGGGVRARRGPPSPPICAAARLTDARNSQ